MTTATAKVKRDAPMGAPRVVKKKKPDPLVIVITIILTIWMLAIAIPFWNVIAISFTSKVEYQRSAYVIWPKEPTLENIKYMATDARIGIGYRSTIIFVLIGVPFQMLLTTLTAYGFSKDAFPGRKLFFMLVLFTMYFGGGIVPLYLLVMKLGLNDSFWAVILCSGCSTYYMIIMRNYFLSLPASLLESARIDGANEWTVLVRITLPLSLPIMATIALFFTVDRWNEWFNPMIFIKSAQWTPLQVVLRAIIVSVDFTSQQTAQMSGAALESMNQFSQGLKMTAVLFTMTPIMCVYPFVQKYFVKGIMIGAIKA